MSVPNMTPEQAISAIEGLQRAMTERGLQKAISTSSVNGIELVRQDLSAIMTMMMPVDTPLRNRLRRYEGNGNAHAFYRLEPTTTGYGKFIGTSPLNGFFPKGGLPTPSTPKFKYVAIPYSNLGDVASVTFQDQAQGRSYTNLRDQQIRLKMMNTGLMEEWAIINGDSTATSGLVWDGLHTQIVNQGGQVLVSPDGKLTAGYVRELHYNQWLAGGTPRLIVLDGMGKSVLTTDLIQHLYALRQTGDGALQNISAGVSFRAYDFGFGVCDWVTSRYINAGNYAGESFMLSLDDMSMDGKNEQGNVICMIDVDPLHTVDLAVVTTAWPTLVYETSTLQVSAPAFQGALTGLSYSGQTPFASFV